VRNFDETSLRKRQFAHRSTPRDHSRTLRVALFAEYEARAFYRRMAEAYAGKAPFAALLRASEKRVGWLMAACRRWGVPCPQDTPADTVQVSGAWLENCQRAANGEGALVSLYQQLAAHAGTPSLAGLFERLARHSLDRQLPALLQATAAASEQERFHAAYGIPPQEAYLKHGLVSTVLEKVFSILGSEHRAIGLFAPVLRNTHPALLTGLAFGGAMTYMLRKKSPSNRKVG
jgi:rubrerythrin